MYCTCTGGGRNRGFTAKNGSNLWVCDRCLHPTKLVFEGLTHMRCPRNAVAMLAEYGRADGIHEITWATADGGKTKTLVYLPYPRKVDMASGPALLQQVWSQLDTRMDTIMVKPVPGVDDTEPWMRAKYEARAIAETLAILMQPFYESADDVAREAGRRYKARQAGDDTYESPGLAEAIWNPNTRWDGTIYSESAECQAAPTPTAKLTGEQEAGIKNALASGAFTPEQLADMFKVPVSAVKALA